VAWEIGLHEDVERWYLDLCRDDPATADGISDAIQQLVTVGPALGRPLVDRIHGSQHHKGQHGTGRQATERPRGTVSETFNSWDRVKAKAAAVDPRDPIEREAGRTAAADRREAYVRGHQLAEMRKAAGLTQAQVAEMLGVTQARVSKIEHGEISGIEIVRAYVNALGGTLDVVATLGDRRWKVP
jgi:DNA-binding XRE family transcriptional regulator